MRANEFLTERWTKSTVKSCFDNKQQPKFSSRDVRVTKPFEGCVLLTYQTVPDLARSFFRVAEYYDGDHYTGKGGQVSLTDFLEQWMDRDGNVDYFKFWDGFNIPDRAFRSWLKTAKPLSTAEQVMVAAIEKASKGMKRFCIIGVGSSDSATLQHELFHARYYLDNEFKQAADQLLKDHAKDRKVAEVFDRSHSILLEIQMGKSRFENQLWLPPLPEPLKAFAFALKQDAHPACPCREIRAGNPAYKPGNGCRYESE